MLSYFCFGDAKSQNDPIWVLIYEQLLVYPYVGSQQRSTVVKSFLCLHRVAVFPLCLLIEPGFTQASEELANEQFIGELHIEILTVVPSSKILRFDAGCICADGQPFARAPCGQRKPALLAAEKAHWIH